MNNSASPKNPHSRPLPQGWSEHFDTERKIWYYVDLDSVPPRASLVHPADSVSQGHNQSGRDSVLPRPLPIINPTASGNSSSNVQASGATTTSAQRLYATGMALNSSQFASTLLPVASSIGDATPLNPLPPPTQASLPLELPPTSVSEQFQSRHPSGRLRGKSKMTHPLLSLPLSEDLTGQTLYNPAIPTSVPTSDNFKPQPRGAGPKTIRNASLRRSCTQGHGFRGKPLPPVPAVRERRTSLTVTSLTSHNQHTNLYCGVTEDNAFIMPAHGGVSLVEQRAILMDGVPLSPISPTQNGFHQPSSSFTQSTDQVILQPRPIKPLQGLTTSFQDQIHATSRPGLPSLEEKQLQNAANRTTKALFRRITSAGPRKPILRDNCRPSRHSGEDSSWTQLLDTSLDESFVVVDNTHV